MRGRGAGGALRHVTRVRWEELRPSAAGVDAFAWYKTLFYTLRVAGLVDGGHVMGSSGHLGGLEAMVMAAVARAAPGANGVAVYDEIIRLTARDPSLPAIHVTLRRLEEKRLLSSREGDPSPRGGKPRRYYEITPDGWSLLRRFRDDWTALWSGLEIPVR